MSTSPPGRAEHGSGTVLLLGIVATILLLALASAALVGAQQARVTAQAGADLGALAGATALRWGLDACAVAGQAVVANGAEMLDCGQEPGGAVRVTAARRVSPLPGWFGGPATSHARAGPQHLR